MIDKRRAASVFGVSVMLFSLVAFGLPAPTVVQDDAPTTTDTTTTDTTTTDAPTPTADYPSMTGYSIETTEYGGYMMQDAEALCGTGVCVAGVIAISAGAAGTVIGANYFGEDSNPGGESEAYYMTGSLQDRIDADTTTLSNSLEATRTMAYREAETAFAESMANDSSKADAQLAAEDAVEAYIFKTIKDEFVRRNNAYVSSISAINGASNVSGSVITNNNQYPIGGVGQDTHKIFGDANYSVNVSVVNADGWGATAFLNTETYGTGQSVSFQFDSSEFDSKTISMKRGSMDATLNDYEAIRGEVVNEITAFADNVSESQYDNLSADEIVSPVNQALEWGESYNDTGSSGYASALASSLGYSVNGTGTTYVVEMPVGSGDTYTGALYADEDTIPGGTIEVNTTYSGADTTAFIATSSGTTTLDEDWEVQSIELVNGNITNSTELSTWSLQELNASKPLETLREWQALKQNVSDDGGFFGGLFGGGGLIPGLPGGTLAHLALILGGGYLLLGGRGGGGSGTIVMGGGGSSGGQ